MKLRLAARSADIYEPITIPRNVKNVRTRTRRAEITAKVAMFERVRSAQDVVRVIKDSNLPVKE